MENVNGNKVTEFKLSVTAKDNKGTVLGKGTYISFAETDEGFDRMLNREGKKVIVQKRNRQTKTDARNDLARVKSTQAQVKALEKTDAEFAKEIKALREKWNIKG